MEVFHLVHMMVLCLNHTRRAHLTQGKCFTGVEILICNEEKISFFKVCKIYGSGLIAAYFFVGLWAGLEKRVYLSSSTQKIFGMNSMFQLHIGHLDYSSVFSSSAYK